MINKNTLVSLAMLVLAVVLTTSCNKQDNSYQYQADYLPVQLAGSQRWSIIDVNTGAVIARDAFENAPSPVVDGMFYVMNSEGTYDYYDVSAPTTPVSGHYGSATVYSDEGVAVASRIGGPLCVIDRKGQVLKMLPKDVSQCSMFVRGMAAYQDDSGNWGFIDQRGDTVIPATYASVNLFMHSDLAVVMTAGQAASDTPMFTVIDKRGNVKFTASSSDYQLIQPYFIDGVLPVAKGDSLVCLDANGKEVANPNSDHDKVDKASYDDCSRTPSGLYTVTRGGKMGIVDKNNQVVIPIEHDQVLDINGERYVAVDDTICRIIDKTGKPVGDATFVNTHGSIDNPYAARGFIDTSLAAASMMVMFDEGSACGVNPNSTLMDLNRLVGSDARPYAGNNTLLLPQGPFIVQYVFDRDIATATPDGTSASFNLDARVSCVIITLNVNHCPATTEQEIVNKVHSLLGKQGFVLARDGIFTSDRGTAVTMGYIKGMVNLYYFMRFNESTPQAMVKRTTSN